MADRDTLISELSELLDQVGDDQDLPRLLEPAVTRKAQLLFSTVTGAPSDVEVLFLLGWLHWYRYAALPAGEDQVELVAAFSMFIPCFIAGMEPIPEPLVPALEHHPAVIAGRAAAVQTPEELSEVIELCREALVEADPRDPALGLQPAMLGGLLRNRFTLTGDRSDLDAAVETYEQALGATPADSPNRAGHLSDLGGALSLRFAQTGRLADLDAAIQVGREAVGSASADHPYRALMISDLGSSLLSRYQRRFGGLGGGRGGEFGGCGDRHCRRVLHRHDHRRPGNRAHRQVRPPRPDRGPGSRNRREPGRHRRHPGHPAREARDALQITP